MGVRHVCLVMVFGRVFAKNVGIQTKVDTSMWELYVHSIGNGRVANN